MLDGAKLINIVLVETSHPGNIGSAARAMKNIPNSIIISELGANVYDILKHNKLIITEAALRKLEERLT